MQGSILVEHSLRVRPRISSNRSSAWIVAEYLNKLSTLLRDVLISEWKDLDYEFKSFDRSNGWVSEPFVFGTKEKLVD